MKKTKRSLLIGIAAMGLVAASAGAVSTFAWFQASSAATFNTAVADTASLGTKASSLSLGKFTLTAVPGTPDINKVSLTDTSGNSYI